MITFASRAWKVKPKQKKRPDSSISILPNTSVNSLFITILLKVLDTIPYSSVLVVMLNLHSRIYIQINLSTLVDNINTNKLLHVLRQQHEQLRRATLAVRLVFEWETLTLKLYLELSAPKNI